MRLLLIGGSGFIGQGLAARARAGGHAVVIGSRRGSGEGGSDRFVWDGASVPVLPPVDAIVNLAGHSVLAGRWRPKIKAKLRTSRVELTEFLVAGIAAMSPRPAVLVNASAVGYYGDRGDEVLDESSPPGAGFLGELCQAWEQAADGVTRLGVRLVKVRIGIALARGGGALAQMLLPFRLGLGGRFGSGRQWMPWVHRDDLVALLLRACEDSTYSGPYNGTAPAPVTNAELTRVLARALHRPAFLPVPLVAARLLLGEVVQAIAASQRVVPRRALDAGFTFAHPALDEALADLLAPGR